MPFILTMSLSIRLLLYKTGGNNFGCVDDTGGEAIANGVSDVVVVKISNQSSIYRVIWTNW